MSCATSLKGTAFDDAESSVRFTNAEIVAIGLVLGHPLLPYIASAAGMALVDSVLDKAAAALMQDADGYALDMEQLARVRAAQAHWSLEIDGYCRHGCGVADVDLLSKRQAEELISDIEVWEADCYQSSAAQVPV